MRSVGKIVASIAVLLAISAISGAQDELGGQDVASTISSRISIENLPSQLSLLNASSSSSSTNGVWILIPSNMSEAQLSGTDFNLFKLDSGYLLNGLPAADHAQVSAVFSAEHRDESESSEADTTRRASSMRAGRRESRKMKLFPNFMRKPQVSPLYLVNGTVCRFVNAQPICTTLTTTGLFGANNRPMNGPPNTGPFQQGQQGQQQLPNQFQQGGQQRQTSPFNQQG